ncbi:MAG TPA: VIT and VWA domain-containing protein [bacterium]|nr:VIT and VWA domain-containing protein [bacterium]HQG44266.1 VIT and VWA domain-containing protein [bacterium]HQJ63504.1 VIT and VWA domain-containing protein [bacterium]
MRRSGALFFFILIPVLAHADGMIIIPQPPHLPLLPHFPPAMTPLEVRYHHVEVKITDQVAVTAVDQLFINPYPVQLEGTYLFPVPRGGQLDRFSMEIDGRPVEAELLDAAKARDLYEEIVRKQRDPALLEYFGQELYRLRIFPILPHGEKHIRLRYTQLLASQDGLVEYRYPLNTEKFSAAPLKSVAIKVEIEWDAPLGPVYSPSHEVEIRRSDSRHAVIGYEEKSVKPDTDFQLFFAPAGGEPVNGRLLAFNDGREPGSFLLMLAPRADLAADRILPKDLVFILDTSGSMAEKAKLAQAKKALHLCLAQLDSRDHFEIVRFSTEAEALFNGLRPATLAAIRQADAFVDGFMPIGGTALAEALDLALRPARERTTSDRPYMVVLITDGKPTVGETGEEAILDQVNKASGDATIRIFSLGVGSDLNTHLLDRLTTKTRAASVYVQPDEEIEVKISAFYNKIAQPVLASPRLETSGPIHISKMTPNFLPDLFKGEQLLILGRYEGSGPAQITLHGTVNGRSESWTYLVRFPDDAREYEFIPRLWASRRIGYLLDQIRLNGEAQELKQEVIALARRYGIVTPYTAFLILEDEAQRNVPLSRRTLQTAANPEFLEISEGMLNQVYAGKSGDAAVGAARSLDALKNAEDAGALSRANLRFQQGQTGSAAPAALRVQQALSNQQIRTIANRTFYQNGHEWVDAEAQGYSGREPIRVRFNSDAWLALLKLDPNAPQWLSAGTNLRVVLAGKLYEIRE